MSDWRRRWLLALAGVVMGAGQAPFSLWWLALAALAVLLWLLAGAARLREAALRGWFAGVGYVLATHFWIIDPFLVDPVRHGWMAPFAVLGLSAGLALIFAGGAALAHLVGWGARSRTLALIPALVMAELFRAYALTGFPWAPLGSLWLETPVAQSAAIWGVHGLSAMTLSLLAVPVALRARRRLAGGAAVLSLAVVAGLWVWGAARMDVPQASTGQVVRVVQPNAAQHLKWDPAHMPIFFNRALDMTAVAGPEGARPDLIVWPETAVPALLEHADNLIAAMEEAAGGVPVLFGVQRSEAGLYYNSLAALRDGQVQVYDKRHLVPFGEYMPFGELLSQWGITHLASAQGFGYAPGPEGQPLLDLGALGKGLPLICYEGIFPQDLRGFPERADWLVLVTNDAWFGKLTMPYAHLDQARMRAIETGLPMIRAANTGISGVIDAEGRVITKLGLGETGYADAVLPPARAETPYARRGDLPVLLWGLGLLLALGAGRIAIDRRRRAA
ncbi:apolipoprotein N-acyltransferase [Roseovarius sp. C7]|uniref:apolipoprotein N-acyltransferase n=1 Tax=Roseovarius sp. C7 TaxID=3398643 RepID=UPI0039F7311F